MHEHEILEKIDELTRKVDKLMGDTTALDAAITKLGTDQQALIAALQAQDDQPAIDAATAQVIALDDAAVAAVPATAPTVTGVSPSTGSVAGGETIVVTGTGFDAAATVNFGSTGASSVTVDSATQIAAVAPAASSAGTVDITVTTPAGTSATSSADQYTTS